MSATLTSAVRRLGADLDALGVRWALVGGLAVSARAEPRTTRDVDVAVSVESDPSAERVVRGMVERGYSVTMVLEQKDAERLSTVRFSLPAEYRDLVADLLFASSGIEPELVSAADRLRLAPGLTTPVATVAHLIALKVLAADPARVHERPQDFADLRELFRVATDSDRSTAREALALIAQRGFHRGKDLLGSFEDLVEKYDREPEPPSLGPGRLRP
ncbi:MAG TPA: nucleotidyl transferase AbiEii/AbiGii toxin family protein [Thermoanaerobaculia bacterium]|nr:nucleotidyl transferase AbiEii/AbiGii toxin family protein [Thermoanaerobaculia bacterium]